MNLPRYPARDLVLLLVTNTRRLPCGAHEHMNVAHEQRTCTWHKQQTQRDSERCERRHTAKGMKQQHEVHRMQGATRRLQLPRWWWCAHGYSQLPSPANHEQPALAACASAHFPLTAARNMSSVSGTPSITESPRQMTPVAPVSMRTNTTIAVVAQQPPPGLCT